jgi:hypothetical protein
LARGEGRNCLPPVARGHPFANRPMPIDRGTGLEHPMLHLNTNHTSRTRPGSSPKLPGNSIPQRPAALHMAAFLPHSSRPMRIHTHSLHPNEDRASPTGIRMMGRPNRHAREPNPAAEFTGHWPVTAATGSHNGQHRASTPSCRRPETKNAFNKASSDLKPVRSPATPGQPAIEHDRVLA